MKESNHTGLLNGMDLKHGKYRVIYILIGLILVFLSLGCILPPIWVFLNGFKTIEEMYAVPATFWPKDWYFENFTVVWNKVKVWRYYLSSLKMIVGCLFFDVAVNGLCGYVMAKIKPKGTPILETLVFWSMLLPGTSMVPLYMTFSKMKLIGSYLPLWMMAGANPFNILLFRNFFNSIPNAYLEAAKMDGASNFKNFILIILPLSKPILVVVTIFSVIQSWSAYLWPYLILGADGYDVPIAVKLNNLTNLKNNEMMLMLMLTVIPPLLIYTFLSKHITGGVSMAGVKG